MGCIPSVKEESKKLIEVAKQMIDTFIATAFEGGRHSLRVDKIAIVPNHDGEEA